MENYVLQLRYKMVYVMYCYEACLILSMGKQAVSLKMKRPFLYCTDWDVDTVIANIDVQAGAIGKNTMEAHVLKVELYFALGQI